MSLPIHRFLNFVYWWFVEKMDKEMRKEFDEWLAVPLSNQPKRVSRAAAPTPAQLDSEGQDFMAFMGSHAAG